MFSTLCSSSLASSESETCVLTPGSSSGSSKASLDSSSNEKSALGPRVAELGIEDGVTTNEDPSFTAYERATKGVAGRNRGGLSNDNSLSLGDLLGRNRLKWRN